MLRDITDLQWSVFVIGVFILVLLIFRMWNRDTRGATLIGISIIALAALFFLVGCSVSQQRRPWMEIGMAYDRQHEVGRNPACVVRVRAPIGPSGREDWFVVGYEHHSSCPDQSDAGEINQIELMAKIPLGRRR